MIEIEMPSHTCPLQPHRHGSGNDNPWPMPNKSKPLIDYTDLPADELVERIARRAAEWPVGFGFAWYLFDSNVEGMEDLEQMRHIESVEDVYWEENEGEVLTCGIYAPTPGLLREEASARCLFRHGSPDLMLAIATGSEPWVASEALVKALRLSEDRYLESLSAPLGSEAREQLGERLRQVLPRVVQSLRAGQHKAELARV